MAIRLARFEALSEALAACDEEIASYDSGTSPRYAAGVNGARARIEELRAAAKPRSIDDMARALDGFRVNVADETTDEVIGKVSARLRRRADAERSVDEARADTFLEIADEACDGEWRRDPR